MKIYEVKAWVLGHKFIFKIKAQTPKEAMDIVYAKPASELLSQLQVGDFRSAISASLINDSDSDAQCQCCKEQHEDLSENVDNRPNISYILTTDDWRQLSKLDDVLVEAWNYEMGQKPRYLKDITVDGRFIVIGGGSTSKTSIGHTVTVSKCRLIEDTQWRINRGYQMVPDKVLVEVCLSNTKLIKGPAEDFVWDIGGGPSDIVCFRIIGVVGLNKI